MEHPLLKNPQVYANGEFKLQYKDDSPQTFNGEALRFLGTLKEHEIAQDCTLIARKIEQMNDREWGEVFMYPVEDRHKYDMGDGAEEFVKEYFDLIEKGVFPGDQRYFDTEMVSSPSQLSDSSTEWGDMPELSAGSWYFENNHGCKNIKSRSGLTIATTTGLYNDEIDKNNAHVMAMAKQMRRALIKAYKLGDKALHKKEPLSIEDWTEAMVPVEKVLSNLGVGHL